MHVQSVLATEEDFFRDEREREKNIVEKLVDRLKLQFLSELASLFWESNDNVYFVTKTNTPQVHMFFFLLEYPT